MKTAEIRFFLVIFMLLFSFLSGIFCARRYEKYWFFISGGGLLFFFSGMIFQNVFIEYEINNFIGEYYTYFRDWIYTGGFFAFAVLYVFAPVHLKHKFLFLIIVFFIYRGAKSYAENFPGLLHFGVPLMKNGVVIQTTDYSCAAAAAATLLQTMGFQASEEEMAQLCLTTFDGTSDFNVVRGLRKKLGSRWKVQFELSDEKRLRTVPIPFLVSVEYSFWVTHMITVFEMRDDTVVIGDPISGKKQIRFDTFLKIWLNDIIYIDKSNKKKCNNTKGEI